MLYFYVLLVAQIVLESFSVSSSGHVRLLEYYMGNAWRLTAAASSGNGHALVDAVSSMYHLVHGVTVLVIAGFFFNEWFFLLKNWRRCWRVIFKIGFFTGLADIITAFFFVLCIIINSSRFPLGAGFLITACLLYSLRWCPAYPRSTWTWRSALFLGCVQGIALLPGISRMGATYVAARWLRLPAHKAFQISLLIEWPLITAAFVTSLPLIWHAPGIEQFLNPRSVLVMMGASIGAWYGLRCVAYLAAKQRLWWFAYYMLIPSALSLYILIR